MRPLYGDIFYSIEIITVPNGSQWLVPYAEFMPFL